MPVFLGNANSMDTFACDCCGKVYPRISMHEHHKIKKANGGKDTRANIAVLDAHCHHALHQIESALKNEQKRMLVPDLLRQLYPDNQRGRENCLYFATTAALSRDVKDAANKPSQALDYSAFDTEDLVHLTAPAVPPHIRDLVIRVCQELKGPTGRRLGVGSYLRFLIEADLKKRGFKLQPPQGRKV